MPWNDKSGGGGPWGSGGGNNNGPWGGGNNAGGGGSGGNRGGGFGGGPRPPDLEELLRKGQDRMRPDGERRRRVTLADVESIVAKMARIPEKSVSGSEKDRLRSLESDLRAVIFGQDDAIAAIASAIKLARSGLRLSVPPGKSILDVMLEAGVDVPYSCCDGICASCETRVLSGIPDHRDQILSAQEQAANKVMMVCCSGSKSEVLVLDR